MSEDNLISCSFCMKARPIADVFIAQRSVATICLDCARPGFHALNSATVQRPYLGCNGRLFLEEDSHCDMGHGKAFYVQVAVPDDTVNAVTKGVTCAFHIGADSVSEAILRLRAIGGVLALAAVQSEPIHAPADE